MMHEVEIPLEWACRIRESCGVDLAKLETIFRDIEARDPSFRWGAGKDKIGNYIEVISDSEDQAYKRGMWLKGKVDERILFHVFERLRRA